MGKETIPAPRGFAFIPSRGYMIERLEGLNRAAKNSDKCRLHPIKLSLANTVQLKNKSRSFRFFTDHYDIRSPIVIAKPGYQEPCISLFGPDDPQLKTFTAAHREEIYEALKLEVAEWAYVLDEVRQTAGPDTWPALLLCDVLPETSRIAILRDLVEDISAYTQKSCNVEKPMSTSVLITTPGQDGSRSDMHMCLIIGGSGVAGRARSMTDGLFSAEVAHHWPEGFFTTVPVNDVRKRKLARTALREIFFRSPLTLSNHRLLSAFGRYMSLPY